MHSLALIPTGPAITLAQPFSRREIAAAKLAQASKPVTLVADKPLPPPSIAGLLVEGPIKVAIESSNILLPQIPPHARRDLVTFLQRAFDAAITYIADTASTHKFTRSMSAFQSDVIHLHNVLHPAPPEPRGHPNPFGKPGIGDRFRYGRSEAAAAKLGELLKTCLGIRATPESGFYADGDLVYRLQHSQIFGYFLVIERRAPDGAGLLSTIHQQITTEAQAKAALYRLELEYQWRSGLLGANPETGITLRVDLDDVSKVSRAIEDEKERMNKRAAQVGAQAASTSYRRQKQAAPPPAGPTLFALPAPRIQEA
jgi:hypothetical protein